MKHVLRRRPALAVALAVAIVALAPLGGGRAAEGGGSTACVPPGVDLSDRTPYRPGPAAFRDLVASYASPEVASFTRDLGIYASGGGDAVLRRRLADVSAADARRPYVLLADDPDPFGGYLLRVLIGERMWTAWIYRAAGGYELRALRPISCDPRQLAWLHARYDAAFARIERARAR